MAIILQIVDLGNVWLFSFCWLLIDAAILDLNRKIWKKEKKVRKCCISKSEIKRASTVQICGNGSQRGGQSASKCRTSHFY